MEKKKLMFSIIIPTLNEELFLPKLLTDFGKQLYKNFEVIVVDGSSEDKTKKKAVEFKKRLNLRFLNVKKRNLSYQRNHGAKRAKGRYLIFVDADCRINNLFTKLLNKEVHKHKHLVYLPSLHPYGPQKTFFSIANFFIETSQSLGRPLPSPGSMIFERDFFNFLKGYREKNTKNKSFFPEDHDIILRVYKHGVKARFLKNVKIKFSDRRIKIEGYFNVYKKMIISSVQMSLKGQVDDNLFDHEMGGHLYLKGR